jgi:nucleoside phosphorylase
LNPELKVGDVLFDEDPGARLGELLRAAGARPGTFHCAKRVAITVAEKAELRRSTGADAVEMESEMIRRICRERKIRSATVRVISDTANEDLPLDFNALMSADQELSMAKLAVALMKSPGAVPRLRELQRNTQLASQKLAEVLSALLRALYDRTRAGAGGPGALI